MYQMYESTIKAIAHDFFPNKEDAEDAIQEVAIRLMDKEIPPEAKGKEDAWAYVVILNAIKDEYRKWKTKQKPIPMIEDELIDVADPYEKLVERERMLALEEGYANLPEDLRVTHYLRYEEELSYEEIARLLGIPVGTVGSRLTRGKELLSN